MKHAFIFSAVCCLALLSACGNALFEAKQDLPPSGWMRNNPLTFDFSINDNALACQVDCAVRYTPAYPFYNLYVQYELKDEAGNKLDGGMRQTNLFDPETGEPLGKGIGNLYEHTFTLIPSYRFAASSKYSLTVMQYMRPDTLSAITAVSIAVRPVGQ